MTPTDLFWLGMGQSGMRRSEEASQQLREAANLWGGSDQYLAAGIAMSRAMWAGWGVVEIKTLQECLHEAIAYFDQCITTSHANAIEPLLAHQLRWVDLQSLALFDGKDGQTAHRLHQASQIAFSERLLQNFADHPSAEAFFVRGCRLRGPVVGPWTPEFPNCEVDPGVSETSSSNRRLCYRLASAFRVLVNVGDYGGAWAICEKHSSAFTTPGLSGWRYAVEAFTHPERAAELFDKAAETLAEDTLDQKRNHGEGWSGINSQLWAPHFRTRCHLALAAHDPANIERHIAEAAQHAAVDKGWFSPDVARFDVLIQTLAGLMKLKGGCEPAEARRKLAGAVRLTGARDDDLVLLEFVDGAVNGLSKLQENRTLGIAILGQAFVTLDRLSLLIQPEKQSINLALGHSIAEAFDGESRLWMHRTLERISDEAILRRILLRLFQNQIPLYAQIRHGPFEYGKDIAVVTDDNGANVLRMYQVKCGNIKKGDWNLIRPQLEEIFQVPIESFQLPLKIDRRIGILVCNGHAGPHVEPIIGGWIKEQRKAHDREYDFLHLDDLISYILDARLVGSLREALSESGVAIV